MHSYCLPFSYVPKTFGILKSVIKSHNILISSQIWIQQKPIFFLSWNLCLNFQTSFFKWSGIIQKYLFVKHSDHINVQFSKKIVLFLSIWGNIPTQLKLHMETFSYFVRWFYFLMLVFSQAKKTGKQNLIFKRWGSRLVLLFLWMSCLLHKHVRLYNQI